jgi:hypothetical protein
MVQFWVVHLSFRFQADRIALSVHFTIRALTSTLCQAQRPWLERLISILALHVCNISELAPFPKCSTF